MTDAIAFYHNPQSRGRIVHWMLEVVNAPYEIIVVDFDKKEHKSADFLAINPMGKFSAADVYVGSAIGWGLAMKAIEPRPAFGAYLGRVSQRPAYQRAMAQSEALTPKKTS